jgi:hypothetical protein
VKLLKPAGLLTNPIFVDNSANASEQARHRGVASAEIRVRN